MKKKALFYCLFLLIIVSCAPKKITTSYTQEQVKEFLSNQSYRFVARYIQPQGGRQRYLTGNYTLKITKDKVEADLPYIGRAYTATMGGEGGIRFSSTNFTYAASETADGSRELTITIHDSNDIRTLFLVVYPGGAADLSVNSNNRQSVSYRGEIAPLP
ncbi:MAG: DUF4251 domain-containing protein [Chitinophagaceae bacterium]|nr:DUF4251 domain-containing protein [Chitinophagaceae bacterium]MCW5928739.1 DUF4251 domain-containing protein [Chitinophagaceae bacterium]